MPHNLLCPDPATWEIGKIAPEQDRIVLYLEPRRTTVACPICGIHSRRIHSHYRHHPWEVPWGQWPVHLVVHARRFFCDTPGCPRRIFVEPFPGILAPYARQTERWRQALLELAHASSAEVAARVARLLGFRTSPDTLIRRQRAESLGFPSPRVLGVDEFALRRGCRYGTLLVDLEQRRPLAVLEGRAAEPLTTWLQAHPTVAILVRDRADAYALAGRQAAPDALQMADRFHLLRNVGDALKAVLHSQRCHQPATVAQPAGVPVMASEPPASSAQQANEPTQPTPRKRAVWEAVQQRRGLGQSLRRIARAVGLDRRTVRKYLAAEQPPVYPPRRPRPTQLSPYLSYLAERADLLPFRTVARSFRQDYDAVRAALTTPWSTGQCEGHICRVKLLKRLGYGRAKLDLLCQRILHRMRIPMTRARRAHQSQEQVAA